MAVERNGSCPVHESIINRACNGQSGEAGPRAAKSDAGFDLWLNHHLCQLYDPAMREPLPAELLKLLSQKLDQKP